jgi:hypothetical protein
MEGAGFVAAVAANGFEKLVLRLFVASLRGMGSLRYWAPSVAARPSEHLLGQSVWAEEGRVRIAYHVGECTENGQDRRPRLNGFA